MDFFKYFSRNDRISSFKYSQASDKNANSRFTDNPQDTNNIQAANNQDTRKNNDTHIDNNNHRLHSHSDVETNTLRKFGIGCMLVSLGITIATSGGSWDISNHLLNKPETFFSSPHAVLYSGILMMMIGSIISFLSYRSFKFQNDTAIGFISSRLMVFGSLILLSAGPFDFVWHTLFGLDGLLSPPHFTLTTGMIIGSIGSLIGTIFYSTRRNVIKKIVNVDPYKLMRMDKDDNIIKYDNNTGEHIHRLFIKAYLKFMSIHILIIYIIAFVSIWFTISGLIDMLTLPFSETEYFNFNPDPVFAFITATLSFPFFVSLLLYMSFLISKTFGIISITGGIFVSIIAITSILPNQSLVPIIPFYFLNLIPLISADALISHFKKRVYHYLAGSILGSSFFTLYFPLITHTFNEVLSDQPVWPSLTLYIYSTTIHNIYPIIVGPAIISGIAGIIVSSKIYNYIKDRKLIDIEMD